MAKELEERRDDPPATAASTVADELLSLILGELAPGASLPSESDLAQRYDVSRLTVREAVKMLAGRGLLELARGHAHPLTTLGLAAGAGVLLGRMDVHPLRVPALGSLFGSGVAELLAEGARWVASAGLGDPPAGTADVPAGEPPP